VYPPSLAFLQETVTRGSRVTGRDLSSDEVRENVTKNVAVRDVILMVAGNAGRRMAGQPGG
jgi:hypothetical protein